MSGENSLNDPECHGNRALETGVETSFLTHFRSRIDEESSCEKQTHTPLKPLTVLLNLQKLAIPV